MGIISTALRKSAKGRQCAARIPLVCNHNPETTILAHAPNNFGGMSNKGHDFLAAFVCSACHEALDHRKVSSEEFHRAWLQALQETWAIWFTEGFITIPGVDPETAKRRPGKKHKWPSQKIQSRGFPTKDERRAILDAQRETQATGSSTDGRFKR